MSLSDCSDVSPSSSIECLRSTQIDEDCLSNSIMDSSCGGGGDSKCSTQDSIDTSNLLQSKDSNDSGIIPEAFLPKATIGNGDSNNETVRSGLDGGCEIYVGKIPKNATKEQLVPLFEQYGEIISFRLKMVEFSHKNRGYAFVKFKTSESAKNAIANMNDYLLPGSTIGLQVEISKPKVRLFVGNIPKAKSKEDLFREFARRTGGLEDVIIYKSPEDKKNNRGFCFLHYDTHSNASLAKKILSVPFIKLWDCEIIVDWADPLEEPDQSVMQQVKILYVRNLSSRATELYLHDLFSKYGPIERIKRIKDFAFIHFGVRAHAEKALKDLNGISFCGTNLEITWSKPPLNVEKREEILHARERRLKEMQGSSYLKNGLASPYMNHPGFPEHLMPRSEQYPSIFNNSMVPGIPPPPPPILHPSYYDERAYYEGYSHPGYYDDYYAQHGGYYDNYYEGYREEDYYGSYSQQQDYYQNYPRESYYLQHLRNGYEDYVQKDVTMLSISPPYNNNTPTKNEISSKYNLPSLAGAKNPNGTYKFQTRERSSNNEHGSPRKLRRENKTSTTQKKQPQPDRREIDHDNNWRQNSGPLRLENMIKGLREVEKKNNQRFR